MMTYQDIYTQVQNLCNDTDANTLTIIKSWINQTQENLLAYRLDLTETSSTQNTVASQANYNTPYNYGKMYAVTVTVGSVAYPVTFIEDEVLWRNLIARGASYTSDIPQFCYISDGQFYLYPTPSSSGNTITQYYHKIVKRMSAADYTTGNISAIANGATTVTGSGTTFTSAMVGRFINITSDGYWYEIDTFTNTTTIDTKKNFAGTTIAAGSEAYTIGEMPLIPEAYHELLIWRPTALYYMQKGEEATAKNFWMQYDGGYSIGVRKDPGAMLDMFLNDRRAKFESAIISGDMLKVKQEVGLRDPNAFPLNLTS
jgi:hypothetical protein